MGAAVFYISHNFALFYFAYLLKLFHFLTSSSFSFSLFLLHYRSLRMLKEEPGRSCHIYLEIQSSLGNLGITSKMTSGQVKKDVHLEFSLLSKDLPCFSKRMCLFLFSHS